MCKEKRMIVKFNGGLGNQMFQLAFARALESVTGIKTFMDMQYFTKNYARPYELDIFDIKVNKIEGLWENFKMGILWKLRKVAKGKKLFGLSIVEEPCFEFAPTLLETAPDTYIHGFFQSEKYFKSIEKELHADFQFKTPPDERNQKLIEKIGERNSVSLHIRRGDYVQKKRYKNLYAACSLDYYQRAVEYIAQKVKNPSLFIFSDDMDWVKSNLNLPYESILVTHNTGDKSWEDLRLMSLCKHNVIANSSFSWWGAWLNNNPKKIVIAPQKWFNDEGINQTDVIPKTWIKLEN